LSVLTEKIEKCELWMYEFTKKNSIPPEMEECTAIIGNLCRGLLKDITINGTDIAVNEQNPIDPAK
jgi:hypothetical protein